MPTDALPASLAAFGPAAVAAVIAACYLVAGEPVAGAVLHRRFEGRLDHGPDQGAGARRSFYRRLLVLEWGLAVVVAVVAAAAPHVGAAGLGLRWPQRWPGVATGVAVLVVVAVMALSTRALRAGALLDAARADDPAHPAADDGAPAPPVHATLALLPRSRAERRLFLVVGLTAGICEEWLYRGFFLAVVAALTDRPPALVLAVVAGSAFGVAHAYQGALGVLTTGLLGGVLAALYLQTGSLLLPVLLHAAIDLRFLLVPGRLLPAGSRVRA